MSKEDSFIIHFENEENNDIKRLALLKNIVKGFDNNSYFYDLLYNTFYSLDTTLYNELYRIIITKGVLLVYFKNINLDVIIHSETFEISRITNFQVFQKTYKTEELFYKLNDLLLSYMN